MLVFMEGGKVKDPEKKNLLIAGMRSNNKLNPPVRPGLGIESWPQQCESSALTTIQSLLPLSFFLNIIQLKACYS